MTHKRITLHRELNVNSRETLNTPFFKEHMEDLFKNESTVKVKGVEGKILHYIGSNLFKVRYRDGNITRVYSFHEKDIDFLDLDVEHLRRAHR
jgi:hypothetical protein